MESSSDPSCSAMKVDWANMMAAFTPGGQVFWALATAAFTFSLVSIRLVPTRFFTSMPMVGWPFMRAKL